jgi:hypothetical protein
MIQGVFCNKCGVAVTGYPVACPTCGAAMPQPPAKTPSDRERTVRRWSIAITVIFGALGVFWDVLTAAILFRSYSVFEAIVVCLLVMILCAVANVRADFELWSGVFQDSSGAKEKDRDLLERLRAHLKGLFYGIAFLMALVKLVLTLTG